MVCRRCIKVVGDILAAQNIPVIEVRLGEVLLTHPLTKPAQDSLAQDLKEEGFELLDSSQSKTISGIKNELIGLIHQEDLSEMQETVSHYLARKLHKDYSYLSKLFSESENMTIEQFVIYQKIEKVKELLVYGELRLGEIAFQMGYSSTAHLSAQFKRVTGFTPSQFKRLKNHHRKSLDEI